MPVNRELLKLNSDTSIQCNTTKQLQSKLCLYVLMWVQHLIVSETQQDAELWDGVIWGRLKQTNKKNKRQRKDKSSTQEKYTGDLKMATSAKYVHGKGNFSFKKFLFEFSIKRMHWLYVFNVIFRKDGKAMDDTRERGTELWASHHGRLAGGEGQHFRNPHDPSQPTSTIEK